MTNSSGKGALRDEEKIVQGVCDRGSSDLRTFFSLHIVKVPISLFCDSGKRVQCDADAVETPGIQRAAADEWECSQARPLPSLCCSGVANLVLGFGRSGSVFISPSPSLDAVTRHMGTSRKAQPAKLQVCCRKLCVINEEFIFCCCLCLLSA